MSARDMWRERTVVYLDILGFKDLLVSMERDEAVLETVGAALRGVYEIEDTVSGAAGPSADSPEMTTFSDCTLVSAPAGDEFFLVNAARVLAIELLRRGVLLRGAMCKALLYHKGRMVFGPALVTAYELERGTAQMPRIIIPSDIAEAALEQERDVWKYQLQTYGGRIESILEKDDDGWWCVNPYGLLPTSAWNVHAFPERRHRLEMEIWEQLVQRLRFEASTPGRPEKYLAKVRWAVAQFNRHRVGAAAIDIEGQCRGARGDT